MWFCITSAGFALHWHQLSQKGTDHPECGDSAYTVALQCELNFAWIFLSVDRCRQSAVDSTSRKFGRVILHCYIFLWTFGRPWTAPTVTTSTYISNATKKWERKFKHMCCGKMWNRNLNCWVSQIWLAWKLTVSATQQDTPATFLSDFHWNSTCEPHTFLLLMSNEKVTSSSTRAAANLLFALLLRLQFHFADLVFAANPRQRSHGRQQQTPHQRAALHRFYACLHPRGEFEQKNGNCWRNSSSQSTWSNSLLRFKNPDLI